MAETPFGELPGETYEEYNNRRLREINLVRIEAGMPPLKGNAESGAEIQAALDASEEFRTRDKTMPNELDQAKFQRADEQQQREIILNALSQMLSESQSVGSPDDAQLSREESLHGALRALVSGESPLVDVLAGLTEQGIHMQQPDASKFSGSGAAIGTGTGAQTLHHSRQTIQAKPRQTLFRSSGEST